MDSGWDWEKFLLILLFCLFLLSGCDPITRHQILTTLFDGVPSLPEPEQICEEYHQKRLEQERLAAEQKTRLQKNTSPVKSVHKPYGEKRCNDCHDFGATVGLLKPKNKLCISCHTGFIKGQYVHGPVAIGACSACHLPHTSPYPSLLELDKAEICFKCHKEPRLAAQMHDKVVEKGMYCTDCHDPHYGDTQYFLK